MEERRLLSKVLNLYADASRVISIRVGAGPGLKGRVTILGVGFEGGVVGRLRGHLLRALIGIRATG